MSMLPRLAEAPGAGEVGRPASPAPVGGYGSRPPSMLLFDRKGAQKGSFHVPLLRRMPSDRHPTHFPSYFASKQQGATQEPEEDYVLRHDENIRKFISTVYSEQDAPSSSSSCATAAASLSNAKGYVNNELLYSHFFDRAFLHEVRDEYLKQLARALGDAALVDAASLNRLLVTHEEVYLSGAALLELLGRRIAEKAVCRQLLYRMDVTDTGEVSPH